MTLKGMHLPSHDWWCFSNITFGTYQKSTFGIVVGYMKKWCYIIDKKEGKNMRYKRKIKGFRIWKKLIIITYYLSHYKF